MYLITDRQVMKMNTFVFDEAEKKLRAQRVAPIIRDQSIEVGELIYKGAPPIAHAQTKGLLAQFVPQWTKIREKWLRAGAPGSVITDTYPVVTPQVVSKWRRAFVKPEYLSPQIAEAPLMAKAREVRRKVLDTFPTLKYILEGE